VNKFVPAWHFYVTERSMRAVLWILGRTVRGLGNVPREGRLIVAANHVSIVDPPLICTEINRIRFPRFLGKEELFRLGPLGAVFRGWGVIPLDRGRGDVRALRRAVEVLRGDGCMVVFPEGTRSRGGRPGRPKPGVALLAREAGAPVLPARVRNTDRLFGGEPFRLDFGTPLKYDEDGSRAGDRRFTARVMEAVFSL